MKESEYIAATNLARLEIALICLMQSEYTTAEDWAARKEIIGDLFKAFSEGEKKAGAMSADQKNAYNLALCRLASGALRDVTGLTKNKQLVKTYNALEGEENRLQKLVEAKWITDQ